MKFVQRRLFWSRLLVIGLLAVAALAENKFLPPTALAHDYVHEALSLLLVLGAAFGRVWATLYLGGRKNDELVISGPYSVCRNPLYLFSALGAAGIALQSHQPLVALALAAFFLVVYPRTVRNEERRLASLFGEHYAAYCRTTPRFWPDFALYREPQEIVVRPRFVAKALSDNAWWLVLWYLLGVIEKLHLAQLLVPLFDIP